jgi:hypothetical protein
MFSAVFFQNLPAILERGIAVAHAILTAAYVTTPPPPPSVSDLSEVIGQSHDHLTAGSQLFLSTYYRAFCVM